MYYVMRSITLANNDFTLGNPTFFTKPPLTHLTYPETPLGYAFSVCAL